MKWINISAFIKHSLIMLNVSEAATVYTNRPAFLLSFIPSRRSVIRLTIAEY
jgi:hypothetical protein